MMAGYRDDGGFESVEEPVRRLSVRTAVAISLAIGTLFIAILYFKGA